MRQSDADVPEPGPGQVIDQSLEEFSTVFARTIQVPPPIKHMSPHPACILFDTIVLGLGPANMNSFLSLRAPFFIRTRSLHTRAGEPMRDWHHEEGTVPGTEIDPS